jgi:pimeloyl-ACP methyl ester carboxylesterase
LLSVSQPESLPRQFPRPAQAKIRTPLLRDQVRFGKIENISGPIPPKSLIILVPGMFSPGASMGPIAEYLQPKGHSVHILESPFNVKADSALASTDWLTHNIDRIRLDEASKQFTTLLGQLEQKPHAERLAALCQALHLKDNSLGRATAQAALGLIFTRKTKYEKETDFTRIILKLRKTREGVGGVLPPETTRKQLYSLTAIARNQLRRELLPTFLTHAGNIEAQEIALEKTIDHVMDQIAPRVVMVGHSLGGFVSMLTLFEQMQDTALVVSLSAPGENGTQLIPPALSLFDRLPKHLQVRGREVLERFLPALRHMLAGSSETAKLKADHQPFNTTIIAVGTPENFDGLVGESNFRMNDALPGRVNVVVTPRQAIMARVVSKQLSQMHDLMHYSPLYTWFSDFLSRSSNFVKGIAYHCGLLQYQEKYWAQNGDILRGLLEAPKNERGQYDYEHGTPDYSEALTQIRRLIAPANYEAEREHLLHVLQDNLADAKKEKPASEFDALRQAYRPLVPDLKAISQEPQPVQGGVADQAKTLLGLLADPTYQPDVWPDVWKEIRSKL